MNREEVCLSKWWTTASAQAAIRRAEEQRNERILKVREQFQAKKQALAQEVENWREVTT